MIQHQTRMHVPQNRFSSVSVVGSHRFRHRLLYRAGRGFIFLLAKSQRVAISVDRYRLGLTENLDLVGVQVDLGWHLRFPASSVVVSCSITFAQVLFGVFLFWFFRVASTSAKLGGGYRDRRARWD